MLNLYKCGQKDNHILIKEKVKLNLNKWIVLYVKVQIKKRSYYKSN